MKTILAVSMTIVLVSACETTSSSVSSKNGRVTTASLASQGAVELSQAETIAFYQGKSGPWINDRGSQYFQVDGTYLWRLNGGEVEDGTWRVDALGDLCLTVPEWYDGVEACHDIWRKSDGSLILFYPSGNTGVPKPMVEGDSQL